MLRIKRVSVMLAAFVMTASMQTVFAAEDSVKVFLNGSEISYEVSPQIISGRTMVPLRATIESITGMEMQWDDATKTVTFEADGKECKHTIGEKTVYINGAPHEFDAPSQIIDSYTLVPVRMIAETSGLKVDWDADSRRVDIGAGDSSAASTGILLEHNINNITGAVLPGDDSPNYIGKYFVPQVSGLGDETFEAYVNDYLADAISVTAKEFEDDYNSFRTEIEVEEDAELKENFEEIAGRYNYDAKMYLASSSENYFSLFEARYEDRGGAHPTQYVRTFNICLDHQKFIKLSDLFKDAGYKAVIEEKLNELAQTDEYKELLFADSPVKIVDENDFYLAGDNLVLFYQPSEIGPYAVGFIVFEIPLSEISELLLDEYKNASYESKLTKEQIFNESFMD